MNDLSRDTNGENLLLHLIKRMIRLFFLREPDFTTWQPPDSPPQKRRSVAIRVVDCGSCNAVEQEILSIFNPIFDASRFGFSLETSPRHADVLLLSGPLTRNMQSALYAVFDALPEPRRVVTVGDDILGQGIFRESYAVVPLPPEINAACVAHIPGDPPCPADILTVLLKIDWG
jgi:Ni,Fe-hydrogenase III small subunit